MKHPTTETTTLSLIVFQSADIEAAKNFYSLLGLSFIDEQHGRGPRHYSCTLGDMVFEIYPRQENRATSTTRIGFHVPSLDGTLAFLRQRGMRILREPIDSPWGRRAVVEDPDGNCVELSSIPHEGS